MHVAQHGARGETYNIGGNNEWTNIDIVKKICELFDKNAAGLRRTKRSSNSSRTDPGMIGAMQSIAKNQ